MTTDRDHELAEIGALLAAALLRLQDRKSSQNSTAYGNNPLDFEAGSDGHVAKNPRELRP
jgi:hypothetical protein